MRHIFSIKLEKFVPHFQETSLWRFVNLWYPLVLSIQLYFLLLFFHFIELLLFNLCWFINICFSLDGKVKEKTNTTAVMFAFMLTMVLIIYFYFMFIFTCIYFFLFSICKSHLPHKNTFHFGYCHYLFHILMAIILWEKSAA